VTLTGLNPAAATRADSDFARAMAVPEALLALRDELPPKQWVSRDLALNRSVVVLTVAAWQAWVETYVNTALATMTEPAASRSDDTEYLRLLDASRPLIELAVREVGRFSTPDAGEVRRLLRLLGHDPRTRWSFTRAGGRCDSDDVVGRLNGWVKVRHAIAHGGRSPRHADSQARWHHSRTDVAGGPAILIHPGRRVTRHEVPIPACTAAECDSWERHAARGPLCELPGSVRDDEKGPGCRARAASRCAATWTRRPWTLTFSIAVPRDQHAKRACDGEVLRMPSMGGSISDRIRRQSRRRPRRG
jgi:hypothetical protein